MENRNGLVVDGRSTRASGVSECLSAVDLTDQHIRKGGTLAGDPMAREWGFDVADFDAELRDRRITPHVAQNTYDTDPDQLGAKRRRSNIDGRTTRHAGYAVSQKCRKRNEEIFGPPWSPDHGPSRDGSIASCDRWLKTVAGWRKSRFRGLERTAHGFHLALAACNLARMPELLVAEAG